MAMPTRPPTPAPARDLTDAEFAELDDLLGGTPEPLEPLDAVMLDGYLCGVIVQPLLLEPATWLPTSSTSTAGRCPTASIAPGSSARTALIARRHAALEPGAAEDGWFDPLVLEVDEASRRCAAAADEVDAAANLPPVSRALMPWVAGFQHAAQAAFPTWRRSRTTA